MNRRGFLSAMAAMVALLGWKRQAKAAVLDLGERHDAAATHRTFSVQAESAREAMTHEDVPKYLQPLSRNTPYCLCTSMSATPTRSGGTWLVTATFTTGGLQ